MYHRGANYRTKEAVEAGTNMEESCGITSRGLARSMIHYWFTGSEPAYRRAGTYADNRFGYNYTILDVTILMSHTGYNGTRSAHRGSRTASAGLSFGPLPLSLSLRVHSLSPDRSRETEG